MVVHGRKRQNEWVFKTTGSLTYKRRHRTMAWMQFQACHCPWRFPWASMLFSSSSSYWRPWQVIAHGRHLQSQPSVFTMEISSLRDMHVECSTALLIKKQMLFSERVRNNSSVGCLHRDTGPSPCFLCCLVQSCLLYYIIYTFSLSQGLIVIVAEI